MNKFKLNKNAQKGVFSARQEVSEDAKKIEQDVENFLLKNLPIDTIKALSGPLKGYGMEALKIRQKIKLTYNTIKNISSKSYDKKGKGFLLKKQYSLLNIYLKEGYSFVMELRKYITKENMGYAIRISNNKEESLGIYPLEDMLKMTTLVKNSSGNFALAFKNTKEIEKALNTQNNISKKFSEELNSILNSYKIIRKNILTDRKRRKENGEDIAVYYPGMNGFILERAFIAKANSEQAENVFDFTHDTDRYSSGGDLQGTEVLMKLRDTYQNLEVKNITDMGASLVDLNTLLKDLEKITEICYSTNEEDIKKVLIQKIFKNKNQLKIVSEEFFKTIDEIFIEFEKSF